MLKIKKNVFKFNHLSKVYWCLIKRKVFLLLITAGGVKKYVQILTNVKIYKTFHFYFININNNIVKSFRNFIIKCAEKLYKPLQKKIFFKGLGFKFKYSTKKKDYLELKLGFSHLITVVLPRKEVKVFLIKKNRLAIEGFDYSLVGNFVQRLKALRFPDSYNGKGFWYKNEFKTLKQIKKS